MRPRQYQPVEIETLENLEAKLKDTQSPIEIATLLKKIAFTGDMRAIPTLKAYLRHEDRRVRANAIEGLGYFNEESLILVFFSQFEIEKDPRSRGNLIKALWKFGHGKVYEELEKMLFSENVASVKSALFIAEQIDNERVYHLVKQLTRSHNKEIRNYAKNTIIKLTAAPEGILQKNKLLIITIISLILVIVAGFFTYKKMFDKKVVVSSEKKFDNIKGLINEALEKKNYSLAAEYLNYILEKKPDDTKTIFLLAKSYLKMGNPDLAEKRFRECLKKDPRLSWNYIYLAKIYSNKSDKKNLKSLSDAASRILPDTLPDHFVKIYLYKSQNEWEKAMKELKKIKSSELNDDFKKEYSRLKKTVSENLKILSKQEPEVIAESLIDNGEFDKAYNFLTIAINQSPMNSELYFLKSRCSKAMKRYTDAQNSLFKAIKLKLSQGRAYRELAVLFREKGETDKALKAIEISLKFDDSPEAYLEYAHIYFKMNDMASCLEKLKELKNRTKDSDLLDEMYIIKGKALAFSHDYPDAIISLKKVKNKKKISDIYFKYLMKNKVEQADISELRYKLGESENIDDLEKLNLDGILLARMEKLDDAMKNFKRLARSPDFSKEYATGWNNLGVILALKRDLEGAKKCFEKSAGALESKEAYYNLGCYYYSKDEYKFAIINFKYSLKIDPFYIPAVNNLALCYQKLEYFKCSLSILELAKNIEEDWKKRYMEIDFNYQKVSERLGQESSLDASNNMYFPEERSLLPELWRSFYFRMIK